MPPSRDPRGPHQTPKRTENNPQISLFLTTCLLYYNISHKPTYHLNSLGSRLGEMATWDMNEAR